MATRATFPKVCIALGLPEADQLMAQARHEIEQGERFLEFRLDYLRKPQDGVGIIRSLVQEFPDVAILATCRHKENHGNFEGTIEQQVRVLSTAIDAGARAVDLEIESAEIRGLPLRIRRVSFVVSYHNWESTPALEPVVRRLSKDSRQYLQIGDYREEAVGRCARAERDEAGPPAKMGASGDGRDGNSEPGARPLGRFCMDVCGSLHKSGDGLRPDLGARAAACVSRGKADAGSEDIWRNRRSGPAFHFTGGA